jgi:glycosyltransferase involved in cell wall biosynthesis
MRNLRQGVLDKVDSFLAHKKISYEVIIVDDGSKDGSQEFIKRFAKEHNEFRLIENPHLGKAGAVTTGVLAAVGEYILALSKSQCYNRNMIKADSKKRIVKNKYTLSSSTIKKIITQVTNDRRAW